MTAAGVPTLLATSGFHIEDALLLVIIAVLLAGSGVLAMAETSLVRTSKIKAKSLVDDKRHGARTLAKLVESPSNFLNPILLLVLVCQLVSATLVGIVAEDVFGPWGVVLGIVFEVVVIFVFFEAVPKNWAVMNPDRATLLSAPFVSTLIRFPPIRWLSRLLNGLANRIIGAGDEGSQELTHSFITDSELKAMADVAHEENVIEKDERTFIHSIIDFGDTVAHEVMTPRPDMVTVEDDSTVHDALEAALAAGFSRIPVEGDGIDDIVGIAYAKDLVRAERAGKADQAVRESARPAKFIPESKDVSDLLRENAGGEVPHGRRGGRVRRDGRAHHPRRPPGGAGGRHRRRVRHGAAPRSNASSTVPCWSAAVYSVDDADELLGAELPQGPWDTVGGLMLDLMGRVPDPGDSVEVDGFRLTAVDVRGRRIERIRIEPTAERANGTGDGDGDRENDAARNGN